MVSTRNPLPSVRAREPNPPPGKWLAPLVLLAVAVGSTAFAQKTPPNVKVQKTSVPADTAAVKPFADITLTGFDKDTISNATVYLENNEPDDLLTAPTNTKIKWEFDKKACILTLSTPAPTADYQAFLREIQFKPASKLTHSRQAFVSVGTGLAFKVDGVNHYYEFVVANGISWEDAKKAAEKKTYQGLPGYLVTITSAAEQKFIEGKLHGKGWLGASDADVEGEWRWKTGPEGKEDGGKGRLFTYGILKGNGIDETKQANIKPAPYTNWASLEPNDYGEKEDHAHFFEHGGWNDYPVKTDQIQGYVVEYGGMGQTLDVSAEVNIVPSPIRMNAWGDVHFYTPDGLMFDYQGTGDYVALQSKEKDRTVVIHARQTPWGNNKAVSVTTAVAMSVAGDKVELQVQGDKTVLMVNGKEAALTQDADLPQGGRIENQPGGNSCTVYWPKNVFMATVNLRGKYLDYGVANLTVSASFEGLLGTLDGQADNDYLCRDGSVVKAPADVAGINKFGDSWRHADGKSLLGGAAAQPTPHTVAKIDPAVLAAAQKVVEDAKITNAVDRDNAAFDLASTGDKAFLESAKAQDAAKAAMAPAEKAKMKAGDTATQAILDKDTREVPLKEAIKMSQGKWLINWELTQRVNKKLDQQPDWANLSKSEFGLEFKEGELLTRRNGKDQSQQCHLFKTKTKNMFGVLVDTDEGPSQIAELQFISEKYMMYSVHNIPDLPFPLILDRK